MWGSKEPSRPRRAPARVGSDSKVAKQLGDVNYHQLVTPLDDHVLRSQRASLHVSRIMDTENAPASEPDGSSSNMPGGTSSTSHDNTVNYSSHLTTPATSPKNGRPDLLEDSATDSSSAIPYTSPRYESAAMHERILRAAELRNRGATTSTSHFGFREVIPDDTHHDASSSSASSWSSLDHTNSERTISSSSSDSGDHHIEEANGDDQAGLNDVPAPLLAVPLAVDSEPRGSQDGIPLAQPADADAVPASPPGMGTPAVAQANDEPQCRICLAGTEESDELGPLIRPCRCTGTISVCGSLSSSP